MNTGSMRRLCGNAVTAAIAVVALSACSSTATAAHVAPNAGNAAANLVGPGCADYTQQVPGGPGSLTGMAQDPVVTAATNNPRLITMAAALSGKLNPDVNLIDTLNGGRFTVFAPVDSAFAKLDPAALDAAR
jgi:uncharacterized surface protein with fasciclin (FAS1) repeats